MKTDSRASRITIWTTVVCLIVAGSTSAFALPPSQVARVLSPTTNTVQCCVLLGPTVRLTEPPALAPVIVTWSTDYAVEGTVQFALSLNGGPCLFYGPTLAPQLGLGPQSVSVYVSGTFQWVVLPADGLKKGVNTFTVCGGGVGTPVKMTIGSDTLTVQISK
jgi:hypothetical protein